MPHFYLSSIPDCSAKQFIQLKTFVSEKRKKKAEKFHFYDDQKRSILAECLLQYALINQQFLPSEPLQFTQTDYGKPLLKNLPEVHFNLSHSGNYVLCGISSFPLGVDIEEKKSIDLTIAHHFFSPQEYEFIRKHDSPEMAFFELWTLKESYIKCKGMGLYLSLDTFAFEIDQKHKTARLSYANPPEPAIVQAGLFSPDLDYQAAYCYTSKFPELNRITQVTPAAILAELEKQAAST